MSGSGAIKRKQAIAMRAARLRANGWTDRNIAETLGVKSERIKALVILGERIQERKP